MTDDRKELRRETPDPAYPDYPPELEWSIESAASGPKSLVRLAVSTLDGFAHIDDTCVTSHGPRFKPIPAPENHRVGLTLSEVEWLLKRLPDIVERLREHHRLDELERQRLAAEQQNG